MLPPTDSLVLTSLSVEGVFLISLNSPSRLNCVSHEVARRLVIAVDEFEHNPQAKVAVIHGNGGNFCAGYDLKEVSQAAFPKEDSEFLENNRFLGPTARRLKKPLLAAVEGYAVAGGLELALLADLRVCSTSARFGVFCRRVGVPLIDGGTVRLPRIVGLGWALELILTGREVGAYEALQIGLVNKVVREGKALEEAVKMARLIASHPQACMLTDRNSVYDALSLPLKEALDNEFENGVSVLAESVKGATKFIQRERSKI